MLSQPAGTPPIPTEHIPLCLIRAIKLSVSCTVKRVVLSAVQGRVLRSLHQSVDISLLLASGPFVFIIRPNAWTVGFLRCVSLSELHLSYRPVVAPDISRTSAELVRAVSNNIVAKGPDKEHFVPLYYCQTSIVLGFVVKNLSIRQSRDHGKA